MLSPNSYTTAVNGVFPSPNYFNASFRFKDLEIYVALATPLYLLNREGVLLATCWSHSFTTSFTDLVTCVSTCDLEWNPCAIYRSYGNNDLVQPQLCESRCSSNYDSQRQVFSIQTVVVKYYFAVSYLTAELHHLNIQRWSQWAK